MPEFFAWMLLFTVIALGLLTLRYAMGWPLVLAAFVIGVIAAAIFSQAINLPPGIASVFRDTRSSALEGFCSPERGTQDLNNDGVCERITSVPSEDNCKEEEGMRIENGVCVAFDPPAEPEEEPAEEPEEEPAEEPEREPAEDSNDNHSDDDNEGDGSWDITAELFEEHPIPSGSCQGIGDPEGEILTGLTYLEVDGYVHVQYPDDEIAHMHNQTILGPGNYDFPAQAWGSYWFFPSSCSQEDMERHVVQHVRRARETGRKAEWVEYEPMFRRR